MDKARAIMAQIKPEKNVSTFRGLNGNVAEKNWIFSANMKKHAEVV